MGEDLHITDKIEFVAKIKIVIVAVLVALGVYSVLDAWDAIPGVLTMKEKIPVAAQYPSVKSFDITAPEIARSDPADAPLPDSKKIKGVLSELQGDERVQGGVVAAEVRDLVTGDVLASLSPERPSKPASVTKILSETASLIELGAQTTFPTVAALDADTLYLVGGGDVLLGEGESRPDETVGHAGLGTLTHHVASELKKREVTAVSLKVDTSLFAGDLYADGVPEENRRWVMEASPIAINRSFNADDVPQPQPALHAAQVFAQALQAEGISVNTVSQGEAPEHAEEIARVESAPLRQILEVMAKESDNTLADLVARMAAIHRGTGNTFESIEPAVIDILDAQGFPVDGLVLKDGSGLSEEDRIAPHLLAAVLNDTWDCMASGKECALESAPFSLPIGSVDGTLEQRYWQTPLAGKVWAKTGSLGTVRSLAGYVYTDKGRPLTFAIIISEYPENAGYSIPQAIDAAIVQIAQS